MAMFYDAGERERERIRKQQKENEWQQTLGNILGVGLSLIHI